jgi:hypothetical protein
MSDGELIEAIRQLADTDYDAAADLTHRIEQLGLRVLAARLKQLAAEGLPATRCGARKDT